MPLFATPFGVVTLPGARAANTALAAVFAARARPPWGITDPHLPVGTFRSRDDLTEWQDAPVAELVGEMLAGVSAVAVSISDAGPEEFASLHREARAWFTVIGTHGCLPPHNHANTSWVAVYCVAAPAPSPTRKDSGALRLHEFRPGGMFVDSAQATARMPYRPGHCTWRPVPGQMAVFPAAITHEVALSLADSPLILVTARVRFVGPDQPWMPPW
ncbi:MAG TPA: putative 2OG-Fe(II) oxygenase [Longimicrobiales bacterium]